jgi:hypothetical protein
VTLAGVEADPEVAEIPTGQFRWADLSLDLLPDQDAEAALHGLVAADGAPHWRETLLRVRARGRATLAQQDTLRRAAAEIEPDFCFFELDKRALGTECEEADIDEIASGGAMRIAAEALRGDAFDDTLAAEDRRVAAAALNRLYGYLQECEA